MGEKNDLPYTQGKMLTYDAAVMILRRARGYVPAPVRLAQAGPPVVGLGPHLKATICLTKGALAFPSQHIGDLTNLAVFGFYRETLDHLLDVLRVEPVACVADLHPEYLSTRFALEQTRWPVLRLQHHGTRHTPSDSQPTHPSP